MIIKFYDLVRQHCHHIYKDSLKSFILFIHRIAHYSSAKLLFCLRDKLGGNVIYCGYGEIWNRCVKRVSNVQFKNEPRQFS